VNVQTTLSGGGIKGGQPGVRGAAGEKGSGTSGRKRGNVGAKGNEAFKKNLPQERGAVQTEGDWVS